MSYKIIKDSIEKNKDRTDFIVREVDNAWIPNDPMNRDWQEYQSWIRLGNVPIAATANDIINV